MHAMLQYIYQRKLNFNRMMMMVLLLLKVVKIKYSRPLSVVRYRFESDTPLMIIHN